MNYFVWVVVRLGTVFNLFLSQCKDTLFVSSGGGSSIMLYNLNTSLSFRTVLVKSAVYAQEESHCPNLESTLNLASRCYTYSHIK